MRVRLGDSGDFDALREIDAASVAAGGYTCPVLHEQDALDFYAACEGLIVAEDDGGIVGYALTHLVERMHGGKKLAWIEHIEVHPSHRRRGIGKTVLQFTADYYKGKAECLHASIHPLNADSLRLFESIGADMGERVLVYKDL